MKRGKNAGTWHHSYSKGFDIIYYLAMQPWRHLEWIEKESDVWMRYTMNEDHTFNWKTTLQENNQDFCRKQRAYPIEKFEIDWDNVPDSRVLMTAVNINGETCYEYPAKSPLKSVYVLRNRALSQENFIQTSFSLCRIVFIGGRNITFRSFNTLDTNFYNDYKSNTTKNCTIKPMENNVATDIEILIGVTEDTARKNLFTNIYKFADLKSARSMKIKYLSRTGTGSMTIPKTNNGFDLTYDKVKDLSIRGGPIDTLIDSAVSDFESLKKQGNFKRGTIIAFIDSELLYTRDAGHEFERHNGYKKELDKEIFVPKNSVNITIFIAALNSQRSSSFTAKALSHVALGYHYKEATDVTGFTKILDDLHVALVANLTERCDTEHCSGFCDGANRCTCPMCCENDCYYTYCHVEMASCEPWPQNHPLKKVECKNDCVGTYECIDGLGCVIKKYNEKCEPPAKCMVTECNAYGVCTFKDACQNDITPIDGRCHSYKCDQSTGKCKQDKTGPECPIPPTLCQELYCAADLTCKIKNKECVKTEPYTEYECYEARCNKQTGMCENRKKCDTYTSCGGTKKTECTCNSATSGRCSCNPSPDDCDSKLGQVCDYTKQPPRCVKSNCPLDQIVDGCNTRKCNETTGLNYWEQKDCSKAPNDRTLVSEECKDTVNGACEGGKCIVVNKSATSHLIKGGCRVCYPAENGTVIGHDKCTGKSIHGAPIQCKNGTKEKDFTDAKCEYPDYYNCSDKEVDLKCSKPVCKEEYEKVYDKNDGTCSCRLKGNNGDADCKVCNTTSKRMEDTCGADRFLTREAVLENIAITLDDTFNFIYRNVTIKYKIPMECSANECIPKHDFGCEGVLKDNGLSNCSGYIKFFYHYSSKFIKDLYERKRKQIEDFYKEANDSAYCNFTVVNKDCKACLLKKGETKANLTDACDGVNSKRNGLTYKCNKTENKCEPDFPNCKPDNCKILNETCNDTGITYCDLEHKRINNLREQYKDIVEGVKKEYLTECNVTECESSGKRCTTRANVEACQYLSNTTSFGCLIPTERICGELTGYYCEMINLTNILDETNEKYLVDQNDKKISENSRRNKCVSYTCVEKIEKDGRKSHFWNRTELPLAEPRDLCETVSCNVTDGSPIYRDVECHVKEKFPDIDEEAAKCNYCKCNHRDGSFILQIYEDTDDETYRFDECGNCIIRNRTTGDILNKPKACILKESVDNKGAIAAATTVGIVVVAVVVAIVVVGIGALQTFQLVSSAMKNQVTSMNENPNFEAADKQATNANFQG